MVKQLVDLKNQLIAYANAVWPGISRAFGDLDSAHARSFLREQRPKTIATLQVDELAELLKDRGRIQKSYAKRLAAKLLVIAQRTLGLHHLLPEEQIESTLAHTIELVEMVEELELRLRTKEKRLDEAYVRCDPERLLMSIPGIADEDRPEVPSSATSVNLSALPQRARRRDLQECFRKQMPPVSWIVKEPTLPRPDRLFSGATSSSPPITFVATTLTVRGCTTI